jgi:hypothetical protein
LFVSTATSLILEKSQAIFTNKIDNPTIASYNHTTAFHAHSIAKFSSTPHFYTTYHQTNTLTTANMSAQNTAATSVNDTPVQTPIEKGKGKAIDDTMDDEEDDSESGEVRRTTAQFHCQ